MPLEKIRKNSLIHKEKNSIDKVPLNTTAKNQKITITKIKKQEVPQSTLPFADSKGESAAAFPDREERAKEASGAVSRAASLTLEAALIFPLCLFVLVTVLSFFRVLQITHITSQALAAAGNHLSLTALKEEESTVKAVGYVHKELLEEKFPDSLLVGGRPGIRFDGTSLEGEYVDLKLQYRVKLPVAFFGIGQIPITQRVRMKKWNGYHKETEELSGNSEQLVYITPKGEVYHTSVECTHLRLSTQRMGKQEAQTGGYTACQLCGTEAGLYSYCYVTEEGNRYHTRLSCSGLKRTVYLVRISEAGGRGACSRCGGGS